LPSTPLAFHATCLPRHLPSTPLAFHATCLPRLLPSTPLALPLTPPGGATDSDVAGMSLDRCCACRGGGSDSSTAAASAVAGTRNRAAIRPQPRLPATAIWPHGCSHIPEAGPLTAPSLATSPFAASQALHSTPDSRLPPSPARAAASSSACSTTTWAGTSPASPRATTPASRPGPPPPTAARAARGCCGRPTR
jgi:hypothetical protein